MNGSLARFGVFEFDLRTLELKKQGRQVRLGHQPARVLAMLVRHAGELVSRDALQREIWGTDTFVDFDTGLSACINHVRTALGDRAASPRFVETLPRRGYRFLADVRISDDAGTTPMETTTAPIPALVTADAAPAIARSPRRWLAIASLFVVTVAAMMAWQWQRVPPAAPLTIAVLPVETAAGIAGLDEASRVVTEGIIGKLAALSGDRLRVLSRLHTAKVRSAPIPIDALRALGASYLVDVTLRPAGDYIRVHAKLAHESGWILWSVDRDLRPADLAWMSARIADGIAADVARELVAPAQSGATRAPQPAAVSALATARNLRSQGRFDEALTSFDAATRLSPDHAASWTGLGETALSAVLEGNIDRTDGLARAASAAARALTIEPAFPAALALEGMIALVRDGDAATAAARERAAIAGDPRAPDARVWLAYALLAAGHDAEAVAAASDAEELAPLNSEIITRRAHIALAAHRPDVAADAARRALAISPNAAEAELFRALALEQLGDRGEATRALRAFAVMTGVGAAPDDAAPTLWRAIAAQARGARPRPWLARLAGGKAAGQGDLRALLVVGER